MERFRGKKILVVGIGKTGFALINFFNKLECEIRVTDIKPIFDLNKAVKKLKKIKPALLMTFGEHREEDFLEADVVVYSQAVDPDLPQLQLARQNEREVYSEFELGNLLCTKPVIAICGSYGRTTVAHMIGYTLKMEGKNCFVGGTPESPFIEYSTMPNKEDVDYVIVEVSAVNMKSLRNFRPKMVVFTNITDKHPSKQFKSTGEFIETKLSITKALTPEETLVINFDSQYISKKCKLPNLLVFKTFFYENGCHE